MITDLQDEKMIQMDAKSDMERRLMVSLQDNAISKMTISELEEKLEKRVQMFDGIRTKVESETRNEICIREQHLDDELKGD
jgi:hypothetical protein